jgi:hypothetical protein
MSQYQAADLQTGFFAERAAVWIGWALLAAMATILLLASFDRQHRRGLETFKEVTGVGDQAFFKEPDAVGGAPAATVIFKGQALVPVTPKHISERDARMLRVGDDDSGAYRIYVNRESAEAGNKREADYFLKLGNDEYLNVRPEHAAGK